MKCKRCGKLIGVTRRGQAIQDGYICYKCMDELGFDKSDRQITKPLPYTYEEIERGKSNIWLVREEKKAKHEQWLEDHPEFVSALNILREDHEDGPVSNATEDDEADEFED